MIKIKNIEIFKPEITHEFKNNENIFYSKENREIKPSQERKETPEATISRLIKSGNYIFNIKVLIKTASKEYNTKIAGRVGDKIITMDGDSIPISQIISITEI